MQWLHSSGAHYKKTTYSGLKTNGRLRSLLRVCLERQKPTFLNKLLYIKTKMHDISILDNIVLSCKTDFSSFFGHIHRSCIDEIIIGYDFCPNKSAFKVSMNDPCCLRGFRSFMKGPCSYFLDSCRKVSLKS